MIVTDTPFMISIMMGIIKVIQRLTKRLVFVRSRFAFSNRSSSCFSRLKARMTGMPVRISLVTRFRRSIKVCSFVNFGMAIWNNTSITNRIRTTATARIQVMDGSVFSTFITPPIPTIGAYSTIRNIIAITCCTCCTSLVQRVIRDAVENLWYSLLEKLITLQYTLLRRSCPSKAATLEERNVTLIAASMITSAMSIILRPDLMI